MEKKNNTAGKNIRVMQKFTVKDIPDLDICVLAALELFSYVKLPKIKIPFKRPLVVGSGNAAATGRIIFEDYDAIFADESTYENKLKRIKSIDGVVLISASGGKHAPIIAKSAGRYRKRVLLITNTKNSPAERFVDKKGLYIFPKNREPYTYNTSTYMGMILGKSKEDPNRILKFIKRDIDQLKLPDLSRYDRYYFIVPNKFEGIIRMLNVKFIELFGRRIARDMETADYVRHSTTVVPSANELFISFGVKNDIWGKDRLHVPLPKNGGYGAMMAAGYYIIGKIQRSHPAWFKRNIVPYTKEVSKIFKQEIRPIVE